MFKHKEYSMGFDISEDTSNIVAGVMLDRTRYRGKGRPKYSDYSAYTLPVLMEWAIDTRDKWAAEVFDMAF